MGYHFKDDSPACTPETDYGAFWMEGLGQDLSGSLQGAGGIAHDQAVSYANSKAGCYKTQSKAICWEVAISIASRKFYSEASFTTLDRRDRPFDAAVQAHYDQALSDYGTDSSDLNSRESICASMP